MIRSRLSDRLAVLGVWCAGSRLGLAALLAGCTVGPDFTPPVAPPEAGYAAGTTSPTHSQAGAGPGEDGAAQKFLPGRDLPGDWWMLFHAPALSGLESEALAHNPTLEAAQQTLLEAAETARAQAGGLFPAVSAAFGYTHQRLALGGFGGGGSTATGVAGAAGGGATGGAAGGGANSFLSASSVYDLWNAGVSVSYTLDVWGGIRRGVEQAQATAAAQQAALEATYLTLTSNVASAAIALASLKAQIGATEEVVRAEQDSVRVAQVQLASGAANRAVLLQQQAQLQATLATLPPLRDSLAQEKTLLASYVGAFPDRFDAPDFDLDRLSLPEQLPVSLPSALVEQRPDVRQAEADLHAATAAVGVATANMLPQFTITGNYGSDGLTLGQLFSGPAALAYAIGGQAAQTLFEGGTLTHTRRAKVAAMRAAAATYRATVLNAFASVSNALQALHDDADLLAAAAAAAQSSRDSLALLQVQYRAGSVNYLSVLTAEQTEATALVALAKARAARFADTVALYAALGGGWWNRHDVRAAVAACCKLGPSGGLMQ